jgi:ribose 5-phosphate isomerase B
MRIAIGGDHHGVAFKEQLSELLRGEGHEVIDLGTNTTDPVDYPDFAAAVGRAVAAGDAERGIIVCGSGVGANVAANKLRGVRASVCHDTYSARQGVQHDDMNVLCLGSRVIGIELANELALAFVNARFDPTERYVRRLRKVEALEEESSR